ncbi:MAG: efflux RND transporter periplasmic adaptor subunit [Candidatus Marinimicrobia bacterium]|nr:efflux RND transporter periplasmic adaptor subunit [Candidatus Neomarinimicrobiota bacterium]
MKLKRMNRIGRLAGLLLLAGAVAAVFLYRVKPSAAEPSTVVRPIQSLVVGEPVARPTLAFPGTVHADKEVDLSFEVPGRLIEFRVRRGQLVAQGELLARLDASNFENQVKNAEADLERARSSLARIERALAANAVSQEEFSQARAAVAKAEAQLAIQAKALADTRLTASFSGVVSDTFADNFDTVAPGRPVLKLQDVATLTIAVAVPEQYVLRATPERLAQRSLSVRFDALPEQTFPVTLKEFAATADPVTQTYRTTFTLEKPEGVLLLPGMTGTVLAAVPQASAGPTAIQVPSDAVGFGDDGAPFVWVLDAREDGDFDVRRRPVRLGARSGVWLAVSDGLAAGERIATAGITILTEGRVVRLMPAATEHAQ